MPVRVRTRIKSLKGLKAGKIIETSSLLNTGYRNSARKPMVLTVG
jgi:hypothetical protein